jgi:RNA polymerase sigma-70 factor, ECF subfamily
MSELAGDAQATIVMLERYKAGDRRALEQLFAKYYDRMLAVVRLRMGAALRAKTESVDLAQEAFMAGLKGIGDFVPRGEGDFFHWLCRVAENRIRDEVDRLGAQKRNAAREAPLGGMGGRPSAESLCGPIAEVATMTSPRTLAARAEDVARLEAAIDALPAAQREALLLVRYEGLSLEEAGGMMERTPDGVRMLVARAMVALGKSLGVVSS